MRKWEASTAEFEKQACACCVQPFGWLRTPEGRLRLLCAASREFQDEVLSFFTSYMSMLIFEDEGKRRGSETASQGAMMTMERFA